MATPTLHLFLNLKTFLFNFFHMAVPTVQLLVVVSYCIIRTFATNKDEYLEMRQNLLDQERH